MIEALEKIWRILHGGEDPPAIVRAARSVVEVSLIAGIGEAYVVTEQFDWGDYKFVALGVLSLLKVIEAWVDQIDPSKVRRTT